MRWKGGLPPLPWPARMVCIGTGPGPKNVLAEFEDGSRRVLPYGRWKYRPQK